jgi:hypothetical protein
MVPVLNAIGTDVACVGVRDESYAMMEISPNSLYTEPRS